MAALSLGTFHFPVRVKSQWLTSFDTKIKLTWFQSRKSVATCTKLKVTSSVASYNEQQAVVSRPLANFEPDIWSDVFTSFTFPVSEFESYTREASVLKEEFKDMLTNLASTSLDKIKLINDLSRLGVAYHFEKEIENELNKMFQSHGDDLFRDDNYDLYNVALAFLVFRQQGFRVSSDVFNKFKDNSDGQFKEGAIGNDAKSILCLYEAAHLSFHGEDILDEALSFSKTWLESLIVNETVTLSSNMRQQIMNALEQSSHRGIERVEASKYIHLYQNNEDRKESLVKFAKLDYNRVQLLYRQELKCLSSWWNDSKLVSEYPYARDRLVMMYAMGVGMQFEPKHEQGRMTHSKMTMMAVVLDDTYDAYGTYDEHKRLAEAIQRWNIDALDILPDYLKFHYRYLLNLFDEFEKEMNQKGRSFAVAYAKDTVVELSNAYFAEAVWFHKGYVPLLDEYMRVAAISIGVEIMAGTMFVGMEEAAGIEAFAWLKCRPRLLTAVGRICRVADDIMSHKFEKKRGHVASAVDCCMKEYGLSEEEAVEYLKKEMSDDWKTINEESMRPFFVPKQILSTVINEASIVDSMYKYGDAFTEPQVVKDLICTMFIDKIPM